MPTSADRDALASHMLAQQLASGRRVRLTIMTTSMAPFLQPGDHVMLAAVTTQSLRVGDIVALAALPHPIVHRLLAVRDRRGKLLLVTKGDSNPRYDRRLPPQAVLGQAVAVHRTGSSLALTNAKVRLAARLLAAISCLHAGTAHLHPPLLRHATYRLLRQIMHVVANLTWRAGQPWANCCGMLRKP
jgi:signal peptidase I